MITNLEIGYTGRLGNQLFQYAACYAMSKKLNTEFMIPKLNVDNLKQDGCFDFSNNQWIPYRFKMYDVFNITAPQTLTFPPLNSYKEPHFHYSENFQNIVDNTSIEGYFQSERYFIEYKDEILKEFSFKEEIYNQALEIISPIKDKEIVAVHIRRGDNIVNPTFPLISMEYIQQALNHFSDKEYNYLVISDDIGFCEEVFPQGVMFSDGKSDLIDLCLMSLADHNIISNSSFSWWGAYLNSNPNKKVIAPNNWFKDKNINTNDLIPKKWIII